jgi:hypothetical protein
MKPLGIKAYGSIPHLIGSKIGPGDHHCHEGQHRICTEKTRDKYDLVIVQEKYDGSNVAIAKKEGQILALTRRGYLASTSPFLQHQLFAKWVKDREGIFQDLLEENERLCGEWMIQAHGLKYSIDGNPIVFFDLFSGSKRLLYNDFADRIEAHFATPRILYAGYGACGIDWALQALKHDAYHEIMCLQQPEGVVYRVERNGKVDFLAKYVRGDFEPGKYLPEISGESEVFNYPIMLI